MFVSPWKRRILVNRFQYRLIFGNLLYLLAVVLAFMVVLFAPVVATLADGSVSLSQREVAAHQLLALHERVWFAIPVLIALCVLHSTLISHRIAGPLHRFKQIFAKLAEGDLSMDINVRRHDYLRHEAEMMGDMVREMGERVRAIQHDHKEAGVTLSHLMHAVGRGAHDEAAVLAGKLGTQMDALGVQVRQFRLRSDDESPTLEPRPAACGESAPAGS
jgi:methyl-accepting chemotaxis protein